MQTFKRVLVVKANGDCRVLSGDRLINLRLDEVAFDLNITIPKTWGRIQGVIDVTLPEPPTAEAIIDILTREDSTSD